MRKIKKYDDFISEEFVAAEPEIAKPEIDIKPGKPLVEPTAPSIIPDHSEEDAPAKAELKKATADDVAEVFMSLVKKSGDDIKKYVELK